MSYFKIWFSTNFLNEMLKKTIKWENLYSNPYLHESCKYILDSVIDTTPVTKEKSSWREGKK